ncbi:hypothetical protein GJ694_05755 [Enterobacter cloacae]|uniref:hypothetical protein n=1 Tax=Enterobacter cloacae TaxID=550 RepID=UPI0012B4A6BC|nr:hypothetical protein [Enterobacter cloacae]QGN41719.1 hypothetical protein GJ694_05755 [Enterobacter cloacae]
MNIYDPNKAFSTSHNDPPDQSPPKCTHRHDKMFSRFLANVLIEQDAALKAALPGGGYALPAKTNHQLPSSNKPASKLTVGPCKRSAAGHSHASD